MRMSSIRRPRRVWPYAAGAAAVFLLLCAGFVALFADDMMDSLGGFRPADRQLESAVGGAFADAHHDDVIVLGDVTDFEWDAVGVFSPYYPHDDIVDEMGVDVPAAVTNHLQYESHCLLVFREDARMVAWTIVSRRVASCDFEATGPFTPAEARFRGDALVPVAHGS